MKDRSALVVPLLGAIVFAAGLGLALWRLPEWSTRDFPERAMLTARLDDVLAKAGLRRTGEVADFDVTARAVSSDEEHRVQEAAYEMLGPKGPEWLRERGRGLFIRVMAPAVWTDGSGDGVVHVTFSTTMTPMSLVWLTGRASGFVSFGAGGSAKGRGESLARALLGPGETLGTPGVASLGGQDFHLLPIVSQSTVPETITVIEPLGLVQVQRSLGSLATLQSRVAEAVSVRRIMTALPVLAGRGLLNLGLFVLFIALLVQRRIAFGHALALSILAAACAVSSALRFVGLGWYGWVQLATVIGGAVWVFMIWASSESWLRSREPGMVVGLDTLGRGRLGPRTGSALLRGWSVGAATAGVWLAVVVAAAALPGLRPTTTSLRLPAFGSTSPIHDAVALTSAIVVLHVVSSYARGWMASLAAIAGAAFVIAPRINVTPYPYRFVAAAAVAALLLIALKRSGLVGLFVAALAAASLPAAVLSAMHAGWMPWTVAGTTLIALGPLLSGIVGAARPAEAESTRIAVPGFVRRLEQERRIRHEMDLLSTMQLRLLPREPPRIDGWDIAARSVLATEAGGDLYDFLDDDDGGLWIAVGDVSGHGYSCAIAQAMTKAGLTSIVRAGETPASVLRQLDRVLRRSGSQRTFTSLALVRLDPGTGEAVWSNAGNPYPILVSPRGSAREVVSSALPLGVGPPREYENQPLSIAPGGALVFYSDGLYEARNDGDDEFGFERPAAIIEKTWRRSASAILDALVVAWRDHVGLAEIADDTTVVVVRRTL